MWPFKKETIKTCACPVYQHKQVFKVTVLHTDGLETEYETIEVGSNKIPATGLLSHLCRGLENRKWLEINENPADNSAACYFIPSEEVAAITVTELSIEMTVLVQNPGE